jgi:hypothetical protein
MALGLLRALPDALYAICDVPEVLAVSFAYLNLALPERRHVVALPDGVWDVGTRGKVNLSKLTTGVVYIPNYMMHRHGEELPLDMTVNAMSLHEMRPAQIAYYCKFMAKALAPRRGLYFDINAHRGSTNRLNDNFLKSEFAHRWDADLTDLSLGARIWTNDLATMQGLQSKSMKYREGYDLDAAFAIEHPYEIPPFDPTAARRTLNEDVGNLIGVDFESWMKARGYGFADPIAGYRHRHNFA